MNKTKDKKRVVIRFNSSQEYNLFQRKIEELHLTKPEFKALNKNSTYLKLIQENIDKTLQDNKKPVDNPTSDTELVNLVSKLEDLDQMQQIIYETLKNVLFAACKAGEITISELEEIT